MDPATYDLTIHAGTSEGWVFTIYDDSVDPAVVVDLTGMTVAAQVRTRTGELVLDLAPSITDAAGGEITISLSRTDTLNLTEGRYLWDLIINNGSDWEGPYLTGAVSVLPVRTSP